MYPGRSRELSLAPTDIMGVGAAKFYPIQTYETLDLLNKDKSFVEISEVI